MITRSLSSHAAWTYNHWASGGMEWASVKRQGRQERPHSPATDTCCILFFFVNVVHGEVYIKYFVMVLYSSCFLNYVSRFLLLVFSVLNKTQCKNNFELEGNN